MRGPCSHKHGPAHLTVLGILFHLDVKRLFRNSHFYLWAVFPKHDPGHVTVLIFFILMLNSFSRTHFYAWAVFSNHSSAHLTVLNFFVLTLSSHSSTFIFMLGLCLPTFPKTTQPNSLFQKSFCPKLLCSLTRTLTFVLDMCSPKHRPAHLTELNNFF